VHSSAGGFRDGGRRVRSASLTSPLIRKYEDARRFFDIVSSKDRGNNSKISRMYPNFPRFYGIFAPAASLRPRVIPEAEGSSPPRHPGCQSGVEVPATDPGKTKKKRGRQSRNYRWATLMERVFELDVLACPRCAGRMRILAAIDSPDAIDKILTCLGLPTRAPPIAPAVSDPDMAYAW
jgi:hypothetical protein